MIREKLLRAVLVLVWIFAGGVSAIEYSEVGCFGSLPSSYSLNDTYQYQSSLYCSQMCDGLGSSYMALFNSDECYCGDVDPSGTESTSDSCDASCYGYPEENCGGTDAYLVYMLGSVSSASSSSSGASKSGSTTSTVSSSSSGSSSTATATTSSNSDSTLSTATSSASSSISGANIAYSTSTQMVGGSTIIVTATLSASATASSTSSSSSKKKANVGAIVGGTVGGVAGLVLIAVATIFILRHYSRRKENERLEKEYQEAIKPVEYDENKDNLYASSVSDNHGPLGDPFDDTRRISTGSLAQASHLASQEPHNKLTVVNPDQ